MLKKNERRTVDIIGVGYNGEGVAHIDDIVVFVPFAIVGEKCEILILKVLKNKAYAKLLKVIIPSKYRIEAKCPYFTKCGGCQLQHIDYDFSLQLKSDWVKQNLKNIGKIDVDVKKTIPSIPHFEYRNKIALPVNKDTRKVGLFATNSHRVIDIDNCVIQGSWAKDVIDICNKFIEISNISIYDENTHNGELRHFVARYENNCLLLTAVVNAKTLKNANILIELVSARFNKYGINYNINMTNSNVILTNNYHFVSGVSYIAMEDNGVKYNIDNASFLQVNDYIKNKIYDAVLSNIQKNDVVIDAYSGAGLLSAMLAKKCKYVYGIEIVEPAVQCAEKLKIDNNINNLLNICGDCGEILPKLINELDECVVVLDPPRKGCDEKVIIAIAKAQPRKIIYISCDHATLSRDLYNLQKYSNDAYTVLSVQPYDMFPQTKHVETVVVLEKR